MLPDEALEALRRVLTGEVLVSGHEELEIVRSLPCGATTAVVGTIKRLGLAKISVATRSAQRRLVGKDKIGLRVGRVLGRYKVAKHFVTRPGGGPDTVKCRRAQARWRDAQRYSHFLDGLIADLQGVYADTTLAYDATLDARARAYQAQKTRFEAEVAPGFESLRFGGFLAQPVNNAVLLGQMLYYHRLADFAAFLDSHGGVADAVAELARAARDVEDPFDLLPEGSPPPSG
jgi:hypothetical protein